MLCGLALAGAFSGCAFGPKVLEKTHGRYQESIRQVDEEQVLRNLVHLRYSELPMALNVSSIAAQYELNGTAEARPFFIAPNPSNSNIVFRTFTSILPDLSVSGANRPTITLVPGDTGEAIQRFLTPIPTETLAFLSETSWPIAVILRLWVERLNGLPNAVTASGPARGIISDHERFRRVAGLVQYMQDHEMASIRTELRDTELSGPVPAASSHGGHGCRRGEGRHGVELSARNGAHPERVRRTHLGVQDGRFGQERQLGFHSDFRLFLAFIDSRKR